MQNLANGFPGSRRNLATLTTDLAPKNLNHKLTYTHTHTLLTELGTFGIFWNFFNNKKDEFLHFYQVNLTESGLFK